MIKRATPVIVGNWKTTPETLTTALKFIKQLDKKCELMSSGRESKLMTKLPKKAYFIAAPDVFIPHLKAVATRGYIGAQNVSGTSIGQVTGATVPSQLLTAGADFTIIGHSEVRKQGETVDARAHKVALALQSKLTTKSYGSYTITRHG